MTAPKRSTRAPRRRHAQLHLPALSAKQALILVNVLEHAISAIYRAHGDAIADLCAERIDPPPFRCIRFSGQLPADPDDLPF